MRDIPNSTGSFGYSETPGEGGNSSTSFTHNSGKKFYQDLIKKADSVPISFLFKIYNINVNETNLKTTCPFPSHKGGRERTASFYYYPQTNTFHCFGCKAGAKCTDFVANIDKITKVKAAFKILELFGSDNLDEIEYNQPDFSDRLSIMVDFSSIVREFRQSFNDEKSFSFIENICKVFDTMNIKHNLSNEALSSMVNKLKEQVKNYQPCHM